MIPHEVIRKIILVKKKRKGVITVPNEIIKQCIGLNCSLTTGWFETNLSGKITAVNENWIEVETKKGKEYINGDYVQHIEINEVKLIIV